jgi:hypothetical protein
MPEKSEGLYLLNNPQAFFFDASILVGFFNKNNSERKLADSSI